MIWDKAEKRAWIIEVRIQHDNVPNRAEREKVTKYQGLMHDVKRELEFEDLHCSSYLWCNRSTEKDLEKPPNEDPRKTKGSRNPNP